MTLKLLDAVGTVIVAIVITKACDIYAEHQFNKGFKAGKESK